MRASYLRGCATVFEHFLRRGWTPDENGCWIWNAAPNQSGYGDINFRGRTYKAHRVSYEHFKGEILTADDLVCHTCDVRLCVNPDHLWRGTISENNLDRDIKLRQSRGTGRPAAKLNEDLVRKIRLEYSLGNVSQKTLAQRYGICESNMCNLLTRRAWRHVT